VLDGALRLPLYSRLVATIQDAPLWVMAGEGGPVGREGALQQRGAEVLRMASAGGRLDLAAALRRLGERGITRLMVEAGPTLAAAFVNADLVDEAVLLRASESIGVRGIDALQGLPLEALTRSPRLTLIGSEPVGVDMLEHYERR
jgi:diaminohydroxyphosphoribosylaminopyrimidine deaminase / 5-amino-6-(5-phosphoribosylamino)uracil reductase